MYWLVGMLIHGVLFGFVCKYLASQKHKDPGTWFAIGFLLGFIGLIVIAASKDESNTAKAQISNDKSIKKQYKALNPTTNLNSPIDIIENQVHIDDADRVFVTCKMKNISDKVMNSIIITIECFNSFGEAVNESGSNKMEHTIQDLSIKPNGIIGDGIHIHLSNYPATRKVNVIVESVMFEGGEIWKKDINDIIPVSIQSIDNDKLSELKSIAGKDAVFYAKSTDLSWDCVCGRTNRNSQSECSRCLRNKQETLENYSEEGINKKVIKIQEDKMLEKAKQEQKIKYEMEQVRKLKLALMCLVSILIVGFFVKTTLIDPKLNYDKAKQLVSEGSEAEAFVLFNELGDYKDSEEMSDKLLYFYVKDVKINRKYKVEPDMFDSVVSVEIPEGENIIYSNIFNGWNNLSKVIIPDSITEIRGMAFLGCVSLKEIQIPEGVSTIENAAFYGCKNLNKIEIPDSINQIGDGAFNGCDNLTIYGIKGSYAEKYAIKNNIDFIAQ